jgi:hypothetical protein
MIEMTYGYMQEYEVPTNCLREEEWKSGWR